MALDPRLARACYVRDGWKCRHCNDRNALHPHHILYQSHGGPDELWNLLTLCAQCHRAHHDGFLLVRMDWGPDSVTDRNKRIRFVRVKNWKPT